MHNYLPIRKSHGFYTGASGGLGYSLPAAVGIALANPDHRVICILGDGSSMYSVQGLWTAAQHHLPITFLVLNNQAYVALKSFGTMLEVHNFSGNELPAIDFEAIARGYGCAASSVERDEDLAEALTCSFARKGPTLLNILVDPSVPRLY
jgi:benzoylformate decarboxylase